MQEWWAHPIIWFIDSDDSFCHSCCHVHHVQYHQKQSELLEIWGINWNATWRKICPEDYDIGSEISSRPGFMLLSCVQWLCIISKLARLVMFWSWNLGRSSCIDLLFLTDRLRLGSQLGLDTELCFSGTAPGTRRRRTAKSPPTHKCEIF